MAPAVEDPAGYRFRARYPYGLDDGRLTRLMREAGVERVDSATFR